MLQSSVRERALWGEMSVRVTARVLGASAKKIGGHVIRQFLNAIRQLGNAWVKLLMLVYRQPQMTVSLLHGPCRLNRTL